MSKDDIPAPERIMDVSPGIGLWRVHVDSLRERDVNARVMADDKFRRLSANIRNEAGLESFPLVYKRSSIASDGTERNEFEIISGHHRTRAARSAGVLVIPVIAIERELTDAEITSKQLAHNALNGHDDLETLRRMYDSIDDVTAKLATGLTDTEVKIEMPSPQLDIVDVSFDFEPVYILFMSPALERWEHLLDRLEPDARFYGAEHSQFDRFSEQIRTISKLRDIRNIAGLLDAVMEYAERGIAAAVAEQAAEETREGAA